MNCTDAEFERIKKTGCNLHTEMKIKALQNRIEAEKFKQEANKKLRDFLF